MGIGTEECVVRKVEESDAIHSRLTTFIVIL